MPTTYLCSIAMHCSRTANKLISSANSKDFLDEKLSFTINFHGDIVLILSRRRSWSYDLFSGVIVRCFFRAKTLKRRWWMVLWFFYFSLLVNLLVIFSIDCACSLGNESHWQNSAFVRVTFITFKWHLPLLWIGLGMAVSSSLLG